VEHEAEGAEEGESFVEDFFASPAAFVAGLFDGAKEAADLSQGLFAALGEDGFQFGEANEVLLDDDEGVFCFLLQIAQDDSGGALDGGEFVAAHFAAGDGGVDEVFQFLKLAGLPFFGVVFQARLEGEAGGDGEDGAFDAEFLEGGLAEVAFDAGASVVG
jgi:hypothetical protein